MKKIICLGSATKDVFLSLDETTIIDNPGDLTAKKLMGLEFGAKFYAEGYREELGGSAVNVASGLNKGGTRAFVWARTCRRNTGKWILKQIGTRKLKKNYMQQGGSQDSQISVVISDLKHNDHVILRTGDSVEGFDVAKAIEKFREKADWIYIGSQKEGWEEDMKKVIEFAEEKKAGIAWNPSSFQIEKGTVALVEFLPKVDILFVNRDEALEIIQRVNGQVEDEMTKLLKQFLKWGVTNIVITDGEAGAYTSDGEQTFYLPSIRDKSKVADTVGAGDAFVSGFLNSFAEKPELKRAILWAMLSSRSVITQLGATNGLLSRKQYKQWEKEIEKELRETNF
jgi:sugar/nucleoside kinase (ribokinase family)